MKIIAERVKRDLYASLPNTYAANQPGRGTIEQIFTLQQIIEKSIEFNNPVHIAFIDFTKAFDSIKLPNLWKLLDKTTINKKYINLLKSTYENSKALVQTDIGTSRCVDILKGLKQGDVLSGILFCTVIAGLAALIQQTESECQSNYPIGGSLLSNFSYADDIVALSNSRSDLQHFLDILVKHMQQTLDFSLMCPKRSV